MRGLLILLAIVLGGAWASGPAVPPYVNQPTITVSGNHLLRNGTAWVPKGYNVLALNAPAGLFKPDQAGVLALYGPTEYAALSNYGADTIRFQVSEAALDPYSPIYNHASYVQSLLTKVADARSRGFVVVISLNTLDGTGWYGADWSIARSPDSRAQRVWTWLANTFKSDRGVMFELLNEPMQFTNPALINPNAPASASPSENAWQVWQWTTQTTLDTIRSTGAQNVVIVEGLAAGHYLENMPTLTDATGNLAFAVHPYPIFASITGQYTFFVVSGDMQVHFGNAAATHPVLLTEWYTGVVFSCWDGSNDPSAPSTSPVIAQTLLDYIQSIGVGLFGFSFDLFPYYATDSTWGTPTSFHTTPFVCRQANQDGPGQVVKNYFTTGVAP